MASLLFRASPIDSALHPPPSPTSKSHELSGYNHSTSSIDPQPSSVEYSGLPEPGAGEKSGDGDGDTSGGFPGCSSIPPSLPGLSALASVASAPTSNLRYVHLIREYSQLIIGDNASLAFTNYKSSNTN